MKLSWCGYNRLDADAFGVFFFCFLSYSMFTTPFRVTSGRFKSQDFKTKILPPRMYHELFILFTENAWWLCLFYFFSPKNVFLHLLKVALLSVITDASSSMAPRTGMSISQSSTLGSSEKEAWNRSTFYSSIVFALSRMFPADSLTVTWIYTWSLYDKNFLLNITILMMLLAC